MKIYRDHHVMIYTGNKVNATFIPDNSDNFLNCGNHYFMCGSVPLQWPDTWWSHQMKPLFALLALCAGNSPVPGEFPSQRPVTRNFDVFFDLRLTNGWVNNRNARDLIRHCVHCPACRTSLIATRFWVVMICPIIKCLTVLEFSFILFDLCLFITIFNFILNYVPIVTFWILAYHKIWILLIIFCFIWSYWIIYFLTCLEVFWSVVS